MTLSIVALKAAVEAATTPKQKERAETLLREEWARQWEQYHTSTT
jgi:hypothetical protein